MIQRNNITKYKSLEAVIFEYNDNFFIFEKCQQGVHRCTEQLPSDFCELSKKLNTTCSPEEMGQAIIEALRRFDLKQTPFPQFDTSARNKCIKKWFSARGISEWEKNQRVVDVIESLVDDAYYIRPYDNNTHHPWIGPEGMPEIKLPRSANIIDIGSNVLRAFKMATFNPQVGTP